MSIAVNEKLVTWIEEKVKSEYADDISLAWFICKWNSKLQIGYRLLFYSPDRTGVSAGRNFYDCGRRI